MKAQIFSIDLVIALTIFLGIIMLGAYFLLSIPSTSSSEMQVKANGIAGVLASRILGTEGVIDCDKLAKFANMSYDDLKTQLGVNPYDIWIEIPNITTSDCPSLRRPVDVMLVLDRSGSMAWDGTPLIPSRINATKAAAKTFVAMMNGSWDQAGLASYDGQTCPPYCPTIIDAVVNQSLSMMTTGNKTALNASIDGLNAIGNTAMGDGLQNGTAEITSERGRNNAAKVIILLSDGLANRVKGIDDNSCNSKNYCVKSFNYVLEQAEIARQKGIIIFTISLGAGSPPDGPNQTFMKLVADKTGGSWYHAPTGAQLQGIFETIARRVIAMSVYGQPADITSTEVASIVRIVQLAGKDYKLIVRVYKKT